MRNGGQGSICDCCKKEIEPFSTHRLVVRDLLKGKKYEKCSSDTVIRETNMYHFCDECKEIIVNTLNKMCASDVTDI